MLAISSGAGKVHLDGATSEAHGTLKVNRPYPRKKGSKTKKAEEMEDGAAELANQALNIISRPGEVRSCCFRMFQ